MRSLLILLAGAASAASAQVAPLPLATTPAVPTGERTPCEAVAPARSPNAALAWAPRFSSEPTVRVRSLCGPSASVALLPDGARFDLRPLPPRTDEPLGRTVLREQRIEQFRQTVQLSQPPPVLDATNRPPLRLDR